MDRHLVNRMSAIAPLLMSAVALSLVMIAVTTGWQRDLPDEGLAAHLFQLLLLAQIPVIIVFVMTADKSRVRASATTIALHLAAIALALGTLFYFEL
jgi:hypothetical protein